MAAKYQLITELYRRTGVAVAKNPQAWQGFLSSACRNYKCRFDEQLLIYAQRPDAVAVAKLETWNRQFKRWVNKDSKGIAVFDPKGRRNTLKYYFDVSDTHEGYYGSRPVPIWQMDERYEQAVMERLSDRFGDVESTDLASALMETAKNAVEDNLQDYFSQLKDCTKDSFLEELDDFNIEVIYRRLAANSVAFMLISRCGLDTNEFFDREDFADIVNFNTPATINAIGVATSDIAEMALREISQSIRNVQMAEKDQNRTFAQRTQAQYDKGRQQTLFPFWTGSTTTIIKPTCGCSVNAPMSFAGSMLCLSLNTQAEKRNPMLCIRLKRTVCPQGIMWLGRRWTKLSANRLRSKTLTARWQRWATV